LNGKLYLPYLMVKKRPISHRLKASFGKQTRRVYEKNAQSIKFV